MSRSWTWSPRCASIRRGAPVLELGGAGKISCPDDQDRALDVEQGELVDPRLSDGEDRPEVITRGRVEEWAFARCRLTPVISTRFPE